jgi:hypothetical protein
MLTLNDIDTIENDDGEGPQDEYFASIQRAINGGAWALQGSYGRAMMAAIQSGQCLLGHKSFKDYYGNTIPGRDDVQAGSVGSYDFVAKTMGQEWAETMGEL